MKIIILSLLCLLSLEAFAQKIKDKTSLAYDLFENTAFMEEMETDKYIKKCAAVVYLPKGMPYYVVQYNIDTKEYEVTDTLVVESKETLDVGYIDTCYQMYSAMERIIYKENFIKLPLALASDKLLNKKEAMVWHKISSKFYTAYSKD